MTRKIPKLRQRAANATTSSQTTSLSYPNIYKYTNHAFLSSGDTVVLNNLIEAKVPIVAARLSPTFTTEQAFAEGTLFGKSLAYLINDTIRMLNAYWPTINVGPDDYETEEGLCKGIEETLTTGSKGMRENAFWKTLGWSDEVFDAFWAAIKEAFEFTKDRRS